MTATTAFATKLKISISAVLTLVVDLEEISFPAHTKVLDEITSHDSTGGWAEHIDTGVRNAEAFDAVVVWDSTAATHAQVQTSFTATASTNFSVEDPGGVEIMAFAGHVTKIERMTPLKKALRAKITIQPTGAVTIT